ncbi:MAG: type IV toxin-antitoxin system AbiEi family antitoxin domain-containing protein [Patescibacteria group bacterium]|nr:type IV toxin-antitoxin system AbiEi family antitoxin domain-containing protein [Patescibacteria group bacterium]
MVRIRPTDPELIKQLMVLRKPYFTVADFERLLGLKKQTLYVTLNRLTRSGVLTRLKKNVYAVFTSGIDIEKIANEIYYPSYFSFEKALSDYGILSQMPFTLTLATLRPSKKLTIADTAVEYSQIKKSLFFGYELKNEKNIAFPEKALLDELYLMSKGLRQINLEELDLREINKNRLEKFAQKYPPNIGDLFCRVKKYLGTTPITNEAKKRIDWTAGA